MQAHRGRAEETGFSEYHQVKKPGPSWAETEENPGVFLVQIDSIYVAAGGDLDRARKSRAT
jgi:hypothetical protein